MKPADRRALANKAEPLFGPGVEGAGKAARVGAGVVDAIDGVDLQVRSGERGVGWSLRIVVSDYPEEVMPAVLRELGVGSRRGDGGQVGRRIIGLCSLGGPGERRAHYCHHRRVGDEGLGSRW